MCANPFIPPPPSTRAMRRCSKERSPAMRRILGLRCGQVVPKRVMRAPLLKDRCCIRVVTAMIPHGTKKAGQLPSPGFPTLATCRASRQEQIQPVQTDGRAAEHDERARVIADHGADDERCPAND